PARDQPAADRERVLHHDPRQAPHAARRAAAARAARARRRVRRGAADGPRSVRAARHHRADHAPARPAAPALPPERESRRHATARNKLAAAQRGREHGLLLERGREKVTLAAWGAEILEGCAPMAAALDAALGGAAYRDALADALAVMREPETTPSARVLHAMD